MLHLSCLKVPGEDDEVDEETMEELQALIEADYEVWCTTMSIAVNKALGEFNDHECLIK